MFARYKINFADFSGVTATTINIPIAMDFIPVDQSELIKTTFVQNEVENAINSPVDNERVRFLPLYSGTSSQSVLNYVNYDLVFTGTTSPNVSTFGQITTLDPFVQDDLKFRRNNLKNTFLRLYFYDTDIPSDQNLIAIQDLFVNIKNPTWTLATLLVEFRFSSPIKDPAGYAEGFYLYHYKDDVDPDPALPKELYMKAEFNNAKDGKTTKLVTTVGPIPLGDLVQYLHTKYLLKRNSEGYYYVIDDTYSSNIDFSTPNEVKVRLYESIVI
jgi:hypothetical protein